MRHVKALQTAFVMFDSVRASSQSLCEMPHGSIYPSGLRPFVVPQNYGATKNVSSEGDPCKGKP